MKVLKRQGDILLEKVDALPTEGTTAHLKHKVVEGGVIARGEVTGHAHVLEGATLVSHASSLYAVADEPAQVVHDEHGPLELEPGVWLVHNQTEHVSADEQTRVYD